MSKWNKVRRDKIVREAEGYLELGMSSHAVKVLASLGDVLETDGRANFLLGESLREMDQFQNAIPHLERAALILPDDIHIYLAMAWCYKRTGNLPLAIESLDRAVEYEPLEAILHYNLACYWALSNQINATLRSLARALEIDVNFRDMIDAETDFDNVRNHPDFLELTSIIV